ncbi:restriction endonuclease subunit S [uncultured Draconibacterium sp.]|uniref:restriction endonuclease subunit S n=1 Tax=uncultured Draconibacterium sp. TaxID=1573823 RepID=UPI0032162F84
MNKEKKLIPELRFPEFEKNGEWEVKEFSSFIKLYRGSSPRPIQEYLTQSITGVNWIKIGDTKNAVNSIINQVGEKITTKGAEKSRKVEKGELILANSMSYGKTYELGIDGCIYDGWFVLREYEKQYHKPFLLQLLNSEYMQQQYQRLAAGGIVQNISSEIVYKTMLFHISRQEQQKIASCLSSLDDVIETHNQKLDALKDHKNGLMQNLFPQDGEKVPKYRFPEFENDEEWSFEPFGKVYSFLITNSFSRDKLNYDKGGVRNIHYGDIHTKFSTLFDITKEDVPFINLNVPLDKIKPENYCQVGDMVFADASEDMYDIGKSIEIVNLKDEKLLSGLHTILARQIKTKLAVGFGGYLFKSSLIRRQIQREAQGAKVLGISGTRLSGISIFFPKNKKEQQKITICLSAMDDLIKAQTEKIKQLTTYKKGLMQGLFPS